MIDGLRPYPEIKDSGIPWFGFVPEHWTMRRLRHVVDLRVSNVDKHSIEGELPIRLCNYVDVYKNEFIRHDLSFMQATASRLEVNKFRLCRNDVVITKDSEDWKDIGIPAYVMTELPDLVCGYHLAILRPKKENIEGKFLYWQLLSSVVRVQFCLSANGVTRYGLSHADIKDILLALPPLPEQAAIAHFLDHAEKRIRRYIRANRKLIGIIGDAGGLINEFRNRLITDVVTGKLDVREASAHLPEIIDETDVLDEEEPIVDGDEISGDEVEAELDEGAV